MCHELNSQTVAIKKRLLLIIKVWTSRNKALVDLKLVKIITDQKYKYFLSYLVILLFNTMNKYIKRPLFYLGSFSFIHSRRLAKAEPS